MVARNGHELGSHGRDENLGLFDHPASIIELDRIAPLVSNQPDFLSTIEGPAKLVRDAPIPDQLQAEGRN